MKFSDLLDELLNEGKKFTDDKYNKFVENAGWWLFDLFQDTPSDITRMPGYYEYLTFVLNNSKYSKEDLKSYDGLVYSLPDYYGFWLNGYASKPDSIMGRTIKMYDLQDKMSGKDSSVPRKRGRKPKIQNVQPQAEPQVSDDDAMAHFDQAVEKRRRGRPSIPDELKKRYIPTGRKAPGGARPGAGRPRKVVPEPEVEPELPVNPLVQPVAKKRGRPNMSKYEPTMVPSKIKTLEDRIASLEALLREKGIIEEQRTILKSRLRMMKEYRKFL